MFWRKNRVTIIHSIIDTKQLRLVLTYNIILDEFTMYVSHQAPTLRTTIAMTIVLIFRHFFNLIL